MLISLYIENILLIRKIDIQFQRGFTVITGETGSGKSIILDSLELALGARMKPGIVREGKQYGTLIATILIHKHEDIIKMINKRGIKDRNGSIAIKRIISQDGESKIYINDTHCPLTFVNEITSLMIEIQTQSSSPRNAWNAKTRFIDILDQYASLQKEKQLVKEEYNELKKVQNQLYDITAQNNEAELDSHIETIKDIESLNIKEDEEDILISRRECVKFYAKISETLTNISLSFKTQLTSNTLRSANTSLTKLGGLTLSEELSKNISDIQLTVEKCYENFIEANTSISDILTELSDGGKELETIENRLYKIRSIAKKYHTVPSGLNEKLTTAKNKVETIKNVQTVIQSIQDKITAITKNYRIHAEDLSNKRSLNAIKLQNTIQSHIKDLILKDAVFSVYIEHNLEAINEDGFDKVDFIGALNKGFQARRIDKIASGGEMSRFTLATKVAISENKLLGTMVFDEIDTGVSGAVASAIGSKMKILSQNMQVICVTHNHQVAAYADSHIKVSKEVIDGIAIVDTKTMSQNERITEIATMMSDGKAGEEFISIAKQLIKNTNNQLTK